MEIQHGPLVVDFKNLLFQYLTIKEGKRNDVYKDHKGILTVGIGHKVTAADGLKYGERISDTVVKQLFEADYQRLNIAVYASDVTSWNGNQRLAVASFVWCHGDAQYKKSILRAYLQGGRPKADTLAYLKKNWDLKSPENQKRNADDIGLFYDPNPFGGNSSFFLQRPLARLGFLLRDMLFTGSSDAVKLA